ncbi:MAG: leucine--tRNA ligase [Phycisphaerales bacterium]|jgi:leucyl-tRNA synthetase|nr:leucine--tRNA ligase [Phycisphaerales bacterium]
MPEKAPQDTAQHGDSSRTGTREGAPAHRYNAKLAGEIEAKWQSRWDERGTFVTPNPGQAGFDAKKPKFYCLDMFPYPSGAGLHVGHPEGYTATDIICRYKRMKGFNVLHPMGWDAFGLPAEQYAIQTGVHPAVTTRRAIDNFRRQLKRFGFSYDWTREFGTIDEEYYRWTQWIFLKIYNAWYDPEQDRARHIDELIAEFENDTRDVRLNPAAAEYTGAGDLPGGTRVGEWETLDEETRRMIVDSYRLAYVGMQTVNWCPKLGTALANEEVIDGRSERGGFPVFRKPMRQWMFRITAYADRLLRDLSMLDWPESTKTQQGEWIGKSEGAEIDFPILDDEGEMTGVALRVFTTRPDTIFGATYMVVAPEHPLVDETQEYPRRATDEDALREYVRYARNRSDVERMEGKDKTGVFTGVMVRNPASGEAIPVWTSDYVLIGYGTGAIMAVPAQDERDWAFAKKFELPIVRTVQPPEGWGDEAYTGEGPAINSDFLNGLNVAEAKTKIIAWLQSRSQGTKRVNYRLRDWLFSRQRYWGEPFPIVWDEKGRHLPVSADALPVTLPEMADYAPVESEDPQPLLAKAEGWARTTAGEARMDESVMRAAGLTPESVVMRETNTMPGWAGSCWYELRYCDPRDSRRFVGREAERYWMGGGSSGSDDAREDAAQRGGVDLYVGGAEHAVLHLLYARFWHKVLFDLGEVSTPEPFHKLFHQGLITSFAFQREDKSLVAVDEVENRGTDEKPAYFETATGTPVTQITAKMSKSLKNVINPDDVIAEFGADTFRLYEMYMGPLEASKPWNTRDITGLSRFLARAWRVCVDEESGAVRLAESASSEIEKKLHRVIDRVGSDIERLAFNTAIAAMIELVNLASSAGEKAGGAGSSGSSGPSGSWGVLTKDQMERFALALAPFAPHMAEELWEKLGHSASLAYEAWPAVDPAMLRDDEVEVAVQIAGKLKARIMAPTSLDAAGLEHYALTHADVAPLIAGKQVRKVIAVPGRLVNIIAG